MTFNGLIALEKFGDVDFMRRQKDMKVFLTMLESYFVIENDPSTYDLHEPTCIIELQTYIEKDNLCRCRVLNNLSDMGFYVYLYIISAKEIWNTLNRKYGVQDAEWINTMQFNFLALRWMVPNLW